MDLWWEGDLVHSATCLNGFLVFVHEIYSIYIITPSLSLSTSRAFFFRLFMLRDDDGENSATSNMSYRGSPQTSQSGPP